MVNEIVDKLQKRTMPGEGIELTTVKVMSPTP